MAYAALVSLARILDQLLHSDQYAVQYPKPQIESLYGKVCSLQSSLEKLFPVPESSRSEVNDLESQIRDAVYEAQDTVESFISRQYLSSESEENRPGEQSSTSLLLQDLQDIVAKLDSVSDTAEKIGVSIREIKRAAVPSKSNPVSRDYKIVGQEEDLHLLMYELLDDTHQLKVVAITGLPGIGKTTLARSIYEHPVIGQHFDILGWARVSELYHVGEIFSDILGSIAESNEVLERSDEQLAVHQILLGRRYLIVMDDVWDEKLWDKVGKHFPDNQNGSRIVLTSRYPEVAHYAKPSIFHYMMHPLDEESSWRLLCEKVFGDGPCPPHLVEIGMNIAAECGGIPQSIIVIGGRLSLARKTVEYWRSIEDELHGAAAKGEESYLEISSLSYNHLPSKLKACFLYMGAFPKDREILVSQLIKLWIAEGFLTPPTPPQSMEQVAKQHLEDLIDRNLISVRKISSDGQVKACGMQDNLRQVAVQECEKEKFFHAINRYVRELPEGTESQRRISVHKNTLMCTEDVYQCTKSIELARTLLYAGPNHDHPLPFCLTFKLLRVLDALTVYFVELPNALFELIHLRYLAFTYDEDLPPSISKLRNLLILIVRQHPKIILRRTSVLPVEIWSMPQIRHLLFTEVDLPGPPGAWNSAVLENLQTLSNVNAACCTKEILQNMPNLKKLKIWIEAPDAVVFYLEHLQQLEAFQFTVLKPIPGKKIFLPELSFPARLKKLRLSGCGIPWEDMTIIGLLPCLEVLKLREFAFQGREWLSVEGQFPKLKFLLLESLDLVYWDADHSHFPSLERLIIRHCYELQEINPEIGFIGPLKLIELVDCSPDAVEWAHVIREEQEDYGNKYLNVRIYSSWE